MSSKNVETHKAIHQAFNKRDMEGGVRSVAEGLIYQDKARGVTFHGPRGLKEFWQGWLTALSNVQCSDPTYIDAGDAVICQAFGRGVNDGPLGPLPATGKKMDLCFCEVIHFNQKGQIVSGELYYDQMSLLIQLGHAKAS
ncbi:MAG: ester cyclase [Nitrospirae bacterium]|nr:ester cyclase [Candidatus Troglogloeales bacterium]